MKTMPLALLLLALAAPVSAQQPPPVDPAARAAPEAAMTDGEIRKVDKAAKKLTIRHGAIRHLDMPPMTMVFQVRDAAVLDRLSAGDVVRFVAEKSASGYVVTEIETVK